MNKQEVYWTTKDGKRMLVDDMDENHVRNTLKMLLRKIYAAKEQALKEKARPKFQIHGDIANDHIDQMMLAEYEDMMGIEDNFGI